MLSRVQLFAILWTIANQAPLSMDFPRHKYWSGLPLPSPGDLPDPGIESASPVSPALQADSVPAEPSEKVILYIYTQEKELNSPQTTYIHIYVGIHVYVCVYIWSGGYLHTHSVGLPWFPSQMV